jgi:dethiobiotin synthetase
VNPLARSLFVAGTDTGVGKTHVAAALVRHLAATGLRVGAMKPVAAGADRTPAGLRNEDALRLAAAANLDLPYEIVNPLCVEQPTSPHLAARRAGVELDLAPVRGAYARISAAADVVIVEGAGGWFTPLADHGGATGLGLSMADLAVALGLPVLLVVGIRLGAINHALLTQAAVRASGLPLAGWVANCVECGFPDAEDYVQSLSRRLDTPLLGRVGWTDAGTDAVFEPAGQPA